MRLTLLVVLFGITQVLAGNAFSQSNRLTLSLKNTSIRQVLNKIEEQSDFLFVYDATKVNVDKKVTISTKDKSISGILNSIFNSEEVTYKVFDKQIILTPKSATSQQKKSVSGTVKDSNGEPLPGVSIVVKGTTTGITTDFDGNFIMNNVPANATLVFSFVGMKTQEVPVANQTLFNITLEEDAIGLEEVVAVGYGTKRKVELTNAVANVTADDFVKGSVKDAAQLIKGKVAGLNITNPDGNPTSNSQIVLRGVTTLASGTQPLIVIDGVPGSLNDVAAEDIESINILKDGSGAAIYGTRGTNGVILITTKGVRKKTAATIEVNSYISTQVIARELEFMSADQYRELVAQGKPGAFDYGGNTKWTDEIFRTPLSQTYNVSMKGGDMKTNYIMNINYKSLEGLMERSNNNVLNGRIQANHTMYDGKLKITGNIMGYEQEYFGGRDGGGWRGDAYRNALIYNPTDPVKDENGMWTEHPDMNNYANPMALLNEVDGVVKITNYRPFGTITLFPIDGLSVKALASRNIKNTIKGYSETFNHLNSIKSKRKGFASRGSSRSINDLLELTFNYTKTYKDHNFNVLGGYSYQHDEWESFWASNYDFPSDLFSYNNLSDGLAKGEGKARMDSSKGASKLVSYFTRLNYNFNNKYMLMASVRYEGSTKFGKDHKWGAFPAVSAGWNVINEPFMKQLPMFSALKLRAGFGVTGTAPSSSYKSLSRLKYGSKFLMNGEWVPVIEPSSNANPDLRWEKKEELNIGLEFGLFNNRISGEIDLYKRTTKDLLWNYSVPKPPYLYGSVLANAGTMENKGLEVLVKAEPLRDGELKWNTSVGFSTNSNKLVDLSNDRFQLKSGYFYAGSTGEPIKASTHIVKEGQAIGDFYGFKSIDIDDEGHWIIEGADGNAKPIADQQPEDKQVLGNGLPKYYLNWNNTLFYKNFDFSVTMRGAFDYQILNMTKMFYSVPVSLTRGNVMTSTYDNIYGKRPLNDLQELQYVSYFIEDGGFWKIDNITIGYSFQPKSKYLKDVRVYASGSNMFTFTGYSGIDPEVNSLGLSPGNDGRDKYPSSRTFTFGVSVKF
ncbi:SusC/RagA family TonB-linked outer membrane protein [Prolixibacteraceae bacterium JC049]|nr:SusC/RagA family TonB-linked outer membrane protein [Prolixibacteraceae bacterium JC049]